MTVTMYDSVDVAEIPGHAPAVAGYVGGSWPTYMQLTRQFPGARRLSIAVNASEDAECLDIENGDATAAEAPAWVQRQLHRGVWRPCLYSSLANMPAVVHELAAHGIRREQVRLWVAHWTYSPHIPAGYDACQWTDKALGRNLDESLTLDDFWPPIHHKQPAPKKAKLKKAAPHRKVTAGSLAGALGVAATALANGAGHAHLPGTVGAAIGAVLTAIAAYLTPARGH